MKNRKKPVLIDCANNLMEHFKELSSFVLSMGPVVLDLSGLLFPLKQQESFKTQFFHEPNTLLMEAESENNRHPLIDIMMDLTVALTNNNEEDALAAADRFYQSVCSSQNISSSQVRDLYFKYLVKLDEISMSNHISLWQREGLESESIWEGIMDCAALKTLHQFLL